MRFAVIFFSLAASGFPFFTQATADEGMARLEKAVGLPEWLSFSGEFRTRYETLNSQFRAGSSGSDQILSLRTLAEAQLKVRENFKVKLELQDSRAELADSGSRMSSTIVNSAELLEANLVWETRNLISQGSRLSLRGGRLTMDVGKRRFIARNRFRNVIQAYTGMDAKWIASDGTLVRTIFTMPVNRKPTASSELLDNRAEFDEETPDFFMWGGFVAVPQMPWSDKGEFYFFGANENDGSGIQTRDRDVYTAGLRLYRQPRKGAFDYEWESMFQFGSVRATASPSDTVDLDHLAWFYHVEAGYSFMAPWSPRVYLEYDYASGDDDPNDDTNERFERFFGPNVLEFGPTSIHTAFVRANISSPGARIQVRPSRDVFAYLSYRAYWLASDKDGWRGASGLSDVSGNSDSFLGHLFFLRIKWKLHPNLKMEGGATYRIDGEFQDEAPGSPGGGNTIYSYFQASVLF